MYRIIFSARFLKIGHDETTYRCKILTKETVEQRRNGKFGFKGKLFNSDSYADANQTGREKDRGKKHTRIRKAHAPKAEFPPRPAIAQEDAGRSRCRVVAFSPPQEDWGRGNAGCGPLVDLRN